MARLVQDDPGQTVDNCSKIFFNVSGLHTSAKMNLPAFIAAAACRTSFTSTHRDPLQAARQFICRHGGIAESQALRKVLTVLAETRGEFAESELFLFSTETLTLIKALAEARIEGRYAETDWLTV